MINSGMRIDELFDNAVEWYAKGGGSYEFSIGENTYRVYTKTLDNDTRKHFPKIGKRIPKDTTLFSFAWIGGDGDKTPASITRLFSTVIDIIRKNVKSEYVVFTGSAEKRGLYDRLVDRFVSTEVKSEVDSFGTKWYLVKL